MTLEEHDSIITPNVEDTKNRKRIRGKYLTTDEDNIIIHRLQNGETVMRTSLKTDYMCTSTSKENGKEKQKILGETKWKPPATKDSQIIRDQDYY